MMRSWYVPLLIVTVTVLSYGFAAAMFHAYQR